MSLAEFENVINRLPVGEKAELMLFLAEALRKEGAPLPQPRQYSEEQLNSWMDEDEAAMRRFQTGA